MTTNTLEERDWQTLLERIAGGRCTPFIGAGISPHPKGSEIASKWAAEYGYPLADPTDLARVAQFVAVIKRDAMVPKERLLKLFGNTPVPDFKAPDDPYGLLADLPFGMYITTNYDNFMVQALRTRNRDPARVVCRWNEAVARSATSRTPSPANPWVFHLHGSDEDVQSLVLTEDDYLDFLLRAQDSKVLPPQVQAGLCNTILFMGYSLADWTFRILFRGVVGALPNSLRRMSVAVQLPRSSAEEAYLHEYFDGMNVRVYWGDAQQFVQELRSRWREFDGRPTI